MSSQVVISPVDITLLQENIIETAFGVGVWGINTSLVFLTMYTLIMRDITVSKSRPVLLVVIFCMYIGDCVSEIVYLLSFIATIKNLGEPPLPPVAPGTQFICVTIFTGINFLLSDGVVCWRAWILYPQNKAARGLLVFCMVGSVRSTAQKLLPIFILDGRKGGRPSTVFWYCLLNLGSFTVYSGDSPNIVRLLKIISMLSGVAIMGPFAAEIFECVLPQLSCIYLSTVILVSLQKSFTMNAVISGQLGLIEVEPYIIDVAAQPSGSGFDTNAPQIGLEGFPVGIQLPKKLLMWKLKATIFL
ncbi:hypothetical protein BDP27DRAFT_1366084 [Rhodocollybia butyracea]|uniref:Uncharacterized protein n=1 Tax=Rhodocollybia butyracea TaxID=206335 RepID=A0A9P5PM85_9AGAR|nr:hypothetical protein BDP27DRAFT_1366084 [Rhodocollybia butyracea]